MSSTCYILRSFLIGDRSMMVYFITRDKGVLHLFVNSINKKKPLLRSFCKLNIDYYGVSDKKKLSKLEADLNINLTTNNWPYEILMSAYYLNELILKLLPKEVIDPDFFDIYERSLLELDALCVLYKKTSCDQVSDFNTKLSLYLRMFEWKLLQVCGYGFNLSQDKLGDDINPDLFYICNPGEMPEILDKNIDNNLDKNIYKTRYDKNIFTGSELIKIYNLNWSDNNILLAIKILMRNNIRYYTNGYIFESRRSLQQYFKQQYLNKQKLNKGVES